MGDAGRDTDDWVAIRRLQEAYADAVTRRAFDELHELFVPDMPVVLELPGRTREVIGAAAFGEFVRKRIAHLEHFEFVILDAVVDLALDGDPDRARGRVWMCELNQDAAGGRFTVLHGVYQDEYARRDGRWWYAHRRFAPLAATARDVDVFPFPDLPAGGAAAP
jgi:hypothetical protein